LCTHYSADHCFHLYVKLNWSANRVKRYSTYSNETLGTDLYLIMIVLDIS